MKAFTNIIRQISVSDADQSGGQYEDLATFVLVGFLSLVTLIVLL